MSIIYCKPLAEGDRRTRSSAYAMMLDRQTPILHPISNSETFLKSISI